MVSHTSLNAARSTHIMTNRMLRLFTIFSLTCSCLAQYYLRSGPALSQLNTESESHDRYYREPVINSVPPPQILSHEQAQNHDGSFKYQFAAENGLRQGETISPDGSRQGGYTYVDQHGKTITVKYTAGKEGFRILEGDHIPRAPPLTAPIPHPGYAQGSAGSQGGYDFQPQGRYSLNLPSVPAYRPPQPLYTPPTPRYNPEPIGYRAEENTLDGGDGEKDSPAVAPGSPNSFGAGYSFQFGG